MGALANELRSVLEEKIASVKEVLEAKALKKRCNLKPSTSQCQDVQWNVELRTY